MTKLSWIAFSFLMLFSMLASANLDSALEKTIYSVVYKQCSSRLESFFHFSTHWESTKVAFDAFNDTLTFKPTPAIQLFRNRGLSPATSTILNSMALHQALNDCFGKDEDAKKAFVLQMIIADMKGRVLGTAAGVFAFLGVGKFFAFIVKKAYGILLLTPFGRGLNPAKASLHQMFIGGVAITALFTPQAIEIYKKKQAADKADAADLKEYQEILEMAHAEMTKIQKSDREKCDKAEDAYEVALIIQDVYKTLQERGHAKALVNRFEPLYKYSLEIKICPNS